MVILASTLTACSKDQQPPPTPQQVKEQQRQQQLLELQRQQSVKDHTVAHAWQIEQSLVRLEHPGTRVWKETEKQELLINGFVSGYKGQYINEVQKDPSLAADPDNIKWVKCNATPEPATTWLLEKRSTLLKKLQADLRSSKVKKWVIVGIVIFSGLIIFVPFENLIVAFSTLPIIVIMGMVIWWLEQPKTTPDHITTPQEECVGLLERVKKPVTDFYTQKNLWPTLLSEEVCVNPVGEHVHLTASVDTKTALLCTIEDRETIPAVVRGKTLQFSYNPQTKTWQCETGSGTLTQEHRPKECRAK